MIAIQVLLISLKRGLVHQLKETKEVILLLTHPVCQISSKSNPMTDAKAQTLYQKVHLKDLNCSLANPQNNFKRTMRIRKVKVG